MTPDLEFIVELSPIQGIFCVLDIKVFPCFFLSCKANAKVKPAKTGHGLHPSKIFVLFYLLFVLCRSVHCVRVNVYCTTATGWLPNSS